MHRPHTFYSAPILSVEPDQASGSEDCPFRLPEPPARGCAFWTAGSEAQAQHLVLPSEAKRSAARGTQGVAHLHSTGEAGEPGPRGPWGGKGDVRHGLVSGPPVEGFEPRCGVNVTLTDSKAGSESMTRRTGCLNWARPDLWEAAEATPPPTRPDVLSKR